MRNIKKEVLKVRKARSELKKAINRNQGNASLKPYAPEEATVINDNDEKIKKVSLFATF